MAMCTSRPCKAATYQPRTIPARISRPRNLVVRAEKSNSDNSFLTGFVVGGAVFGALGFLFAPQISKALLNNDESLKLPKFMEEEQSKDPQQIKEDLIQKIAQLNASIDQVSTQLKSKDEVKVDAA